MMCKGSLLWKVYSPLKCARFGAKSFGLCETKSGYVWNLLIYIGQDIIFDKYLKNEPQGSKVVLQLMCNHGQLVLKPKSVPYAVQQTD
jgi:hypothetical protein